MTDSPQQQSTTPDAAPGDGTGTPQSPDETPVEAADTRRVAGIQDDAKLTPADRMDELANEVAAEAVAEDTNDTPG